MKMKRLDTAEKRSEANTSSSYRKILTGEGLTYVCALLCTKELCVTPDVERCDFGRLKNLLHANRHLSWKDVALKWMTGTREMRNHEAMACHTGGNNSHADEIFTLFNRHDQTRKKGLIYFPLLKFILGLEEKNGRVSAQADPTRSRSIAQHAQFHKSTWTSYPLQL